MSSNKEQPTFRTTFDLPRDLHKRLKVLSVIAERDMVEIVCEALGKYLEAANNTPEQDSKAA